MLQCGEQEEVGIVIECDVLGCLYRGALKDAELDNWRWVDGTAVIRSWVFKLAV